MKPTLGHGWHHLWLTSMRTHASCQRLSLQGLRELAGDVMCAWNIADEVESAGTEPRCDLEALRIACLWHMRCVVRDAIAAESRRTPSEELWQLWQSVLATEAAWEAAEAALLSRVLKEHRTDLVMAEMVGIERPWFNRACGGDA